MNRLTKDKPIFFPVIVSRVEMQMLIQTVLLQGFEFHIASRPDPFSENTLIRKSPS